MPATGRNEVVTILVRGLQCGAVEAYYESAGESASRTWPRRAETGRALPDDSEGRRVNLPLASELDERLDKAHLTARPSSIVVAHTFLAWGQRDDFISDHLSSSGAIRHKATIRWGQTENVEAVAIATQALGIDRFLFVQLGGLILKVPCDDLELLASVR
jgi:hypothetical protein